MPMQDQTTAKWSQIIAHTKIAVILGAHVPTASNTRDTNTHTQSICEWVNKLHLCRLLCSGRTIDLFSFPRQELNFNAFLHQFGSFEWTKSANLNPCLSDLRLHSNRIKNFAGWWVLSMDFNGILKLIAPIQYTKRIHIEMYWSYVLSTIIWFT